jgi:hypothetical protein
MNGVRLMVVGNSLEAETICGLLRTEGIACDHRHTDVGAGAGDAIGDSGRARSWWRGTTSRARGSLSPPTPRRARCFWSHGSFSAMPNRVLLFPGLSCGRQANMASRRLRSGPVGGETMSGGHCSSQRPPRTTDLLQSVADRATPVRLRNRTLDGTPTGQRFVAVTSRSHLVLRAK